MRHAALPSRIAERLIGCYPAQGRASRKSIVPALATSSCLFLASLTAPHEHGCAICSVNEPSILLLLIPSHNSRLIPCHHLQQRGREPQPSCPRAPRRP